MEVCEGTPDDVVANGNTDASGNEDATDDVLTTGKEIAIGKGAALASVAANADACDNSVSNDCDENDEDPIYLEYRDWKVVILLIHV